MSLSAVIILNMSDALKLMSAFSAHCLAQTTDWIKHLKLQVTNYLQKIDRLGVSGY
jgi:hypothetical protein